MIKIKDNKPSNKKSSQNILATSKYLSLSVFLIYSLFVFIIGTRKNQLINFTKNIIPTTTKLKIRNSVPFQFYQSNFKANIPRNFFLGLTQKVDPIYLDIKQKDLNKLERKRKDAISQGVLISSNNDFVNAVISDKSSAIKAKIRLKGDWTDHLSSNTPSFRVQIKGGKTFLGMNRFSLQMPLTRNFIWEWVYHQFLKEEGLPSLRYKFQPLIINGDYKGIYAIEEHFDKILIESNKFKEGPILKLSEDRLWAQRAENFSDQDEYFKTFSTGFRVGKINKNQVLKENFIVANQLLNGFHEGKLKTSEVFDIKSLAKFHAISDLLGADHGLTWHNLRFYYDPVKARLIPIGFDANPNIKPFGIEKISIESNSIWLNSLYKDLDFSREYIKTLNRVSSKDYLDKFFNLNQKEFNEKKSILYKSYPGLDFDKNYIYSNQEKIRKYLKPNSPLNVFLESIDEKNIRLNIGNNQAIPISIENIMIGESKINLLNQNLILEGKNNNSFVKYSDLIIPINKNNFKDFQAGEEVLITYKLNGLNRFDKSKVNLYPRLSPDEIKQTILQKSSDLNNINFLEINEQNKIIKFKQEKIFINKPLVIPSGYILKALPGTNLIIEKRGLILSRSPIEFLGNNSKKVIIESSNLNNGNGIIILDADETSTIKNVLFKNLESINISNWSVPGSVTFYESPVKIENSIFENNNSEDSLNIVRSDFSLKNSYFYNSKSDAIDIDFSDGVIENITIMNSLNDGLDLSGSNIKGRQIFISNSGDKAFSIGEASNVDIENLNINKAFVGIASKDGSKSKIKNLSINNANYDFAVFKKKYEYTFPYASIAQFNKDINSVNYLLGFGSTLSVNKEKFKENYDNNYIFNILYR